MVKKWSLSLMKNMKYYPMLLELKGKKCLIIGGGPVAAHKTRSLLKAGAMVSIISPVLTKSLMNLSKSKKIFHIKSEYHKKFLKNAFLVIAATNKKEINLKVSKDARVLGLLVNIVDMPALSNFIVPAVLCRKDLIISISTSGKAPVLSKKIKEDLRKLIPCYAKMVRPLASIRHKLKLKYPDADMRKSVLRACL
ncbi:MAG: bifunctional precorrin-2 dehydrogenase/sirohydrochlorin ferrochelatase [Elusimicrobiota bacterium]